MCRFLCRHLFSFFFSKCQGAQILGHMVRVCLQKPSICLPKCLYDFAPLPAMYESSCCSIPSPAFGVVNVLDIDHFNRCVVVSLFFLLQYSCFFKYNFIYLFIFGSAGCSLLHGLCSSCGERRCSPAVVCGLLIGIASLVGEHGLLGLQSLWLLGSGARAQQL